MSRTRWVIVGGALIVVGAATIGGFFYAAEKARKEIEEWMPLRPNATIGNRELTKRIENADTRLKNGFLPLAALVELSRLYHVNGFYDEASDCYEALKVLQPEEPHWPHLLSKIKASYGLLDEAIANERETVALAPDYLPAWIDLGNALLKRNQAAEAEKAFRVVLEKDAKQAYALLGLARVSIARDNWTAAEPQLEGAVKQSKGKVGVELLATVYRELGKVESADRLLFAHEIGLHTDPADPWLEALMVDCYDPYALSLASGMAGRRGDREGAQRWIERAGELAPRDPMILFQLAHTAAGSGHNQEALRFYEKCVRLKPDFSDGWHYLYISYRNLGNLAAAERTLSKGFENCPDSPALLIEVANGLQAQKKYQRAIGLLNKSIRLRPNEALAYVSLARIHFARKNVERGIQSMRDALHAEPGHPLALTTLAMHAIENGNKETARKYLAKIRLQPKVDPEDAASLYASFQKRFQN